MKRILFMTVGTGVGISENRKKNLAHGLLTSILHYNPDKILFFGSEESKETIEEIKKQYQKERKKALDGYEVVLSEQIDDFLNCFSRIKEKIDQYNKDEIIIDYTSGTKTMTISAALSAMLYKKKLTLVSGMREMGIVKKNTEQIVTQNLFVVYDVVLEERLREDFNNYRFVEAKKKLEMITGMPAEKKQYYTNIINAFDKWDKFQHEEAKEYLLKISKELGEKKDFLGKLTYRKNLSKDYILVDLFNNVERRMKEEKYDDAIARMYRIIELLAHIRLEKRFNIDTSDVQLSIILKFAGKEVAAKYQKENNVQDKIKIGLKKAYMLLDDLNDELGKRFIGDKRIAHLLTERNNSILAHGLKAIKKEKAMELKEKIKEYISITVEDERKLIKKIEQGRFPQL